jgi:Holliday junction resolvasome RuvABC endonuclease subunit
MTARMVVVGFDPGGERSGWAALEISGSAAQPRAAFLGTGDVESTGPALDVFFASCAPLARYPGRVVAVERTKGKAYSDKGAGVVPHLIECARADSMICENARVRGLRVVQLPAVEWRRHVCGRHDPDDALVKVTILRFVAGWPSRSNPHNRDAAGVALAAAMKSGVGWS